MPIEVRIPTLGESVSEGVIVRWMKADGDVVQSDEPLLELETDKASVEIPAPRAGVLRIVKREGEKVQVGDVVGRVDEHEGIQPGPSVHPTTATAAPQQEPTTTRPSPILSPAVRRLVEEHHLDAQTIIATGRGGRLTKEDVLAHLDRISVARVEEQAAASQVAQLKPQDAGPQPERSQPVPPQAERPPADRLRGEEEERVPMTHLRQRIAERLVQAQQTAAILTTFNEADMSALMELRARHKERFKQVHSVSLGLMSFFARACIGALMEFPVVNARIDGGDIVYKKRVHLAVAVNTERGLVVPVIHSADQLSFAEIEEEIERLAGLARQNKLGIQDLSGGTFTISNGGVYGSLLSTPILTPPQSAILGMHKIEKRPVAIDDAVVIRPMMYLALSYDHRLIDGEQAVRFLVAVKERIEDPTRLLFEI
jgi:2-oxoglutarate dehydrogenase E2 component (dihydrolipoamide succinyltransferase)